MGGCNFRQSCIPTEPIEIARNMSLFYQKFQQQRLSLSKFRRQGSMVAKNPTCSAELVGKLGEICTQDNNGTVGYQVEAAEKHHLYQF